MVEVKICGVRDPRAVAAVAEAGADWIGFNFFPPSPRFVTPAETAGLAATLPPKGPAPVGVFVDPTDREVGDTMAAVPLRALQLHGVTPSRAADIAARFAVPVWLAIGVAEGSDLPRTAAAVSRLFLDRRAAATDRLPGGNARPFNWDVLQGWAAPLPWILAGGLTPDNVAEAIRQTGATAVDVASGVESSRGVKDPALIRAFIEAARAA